MTVKELRQVLCGPAEKLVILVDWEGEDIDLTYPSPVQAAFDDYVVGNLASLEAYKYRIYLKREYVRENDAPRFEAAHERKRMAG